MVKVKVDEGVEKVFPAFPAKLQSVESPNNIKTIHIAHSDLDVNGHVNNVKYIKLAALTRHQGIRGKRLRHPMYASTPYFVREVIITTKISNIKLLI